MVRANVWLFVVISLAALCPSTGWSQPAQANVPSQKSTEGSSFRIYVLDNLSEDAEFCHWVAMTIPMAVGPETWKGAGGTGNCSYYPPTKTLVVHHTPEIQAQVDAFLKSIKKAVPQERGSVAAGARMQTPGIIQAQHTVPKVIQTGEAAPGASYLVPAPAKQPKHLFHFVLRFEGDGTAEASAPDAGKTEPAQDSPVVQAQNVISKAIQGGDAATLNVMPALAKSKSLFHCIVRYEGEGIIDSNVVELFKSYVAAASQDGAARTPPPSMNGPATGTSNKVPETAPGAPSAPIPASDEGVNPPARTAPPASLPAPKTDTDPKDAG